MQARQGVDDRVGTFSGVGQQPGSARTVREDVLHRFARVVGHGERSDAPAGRISTDSPGSDSAPYDILLGEARRLGGAVGAVDVEPASGGPAQRRRPTWSECSWVTKTASSDVELEPGTL